MESTEELYSYAHLLGRGSPIEYSRNYIQGNRSRVVQENVRLICASPQHFRSESREKHFCKSPLNPRLGSTENRSIQSSDSSSVTIWIEAQQAFEVPSQISIKITQPDNVRFHLDG